MNQSSQSEYRVRVLIVDDSEDDAFLLRRTLQKGGYEVYCEVVDTPSAMRSALDEQDWDVITSDHAMPHFSAPAALALAKELRPDVPFIIVSGEIDLNLAVSLMKGGAQDYIQKRELARLVPAIERELREMELKRERLRNEAALSENEQWHRTILQTAMDGFWMVDMQGRLKEVNQSYCRMSGYSMQELLGMSIFDLESEEAANNTATHIQKVMAQGQDRFQTQHHRKDGRIFDVEVSAQYRDNEGGQIVAFLRDITEQKQAEEALRENNELLNLFVRHSPIYCYIKEVNPTQSVVLQASDNFQQMVGIPGSDIIGCTMKDLYPPEFAAKITADDWAVVSTGDVRRLDEELDGRSYTTIKFPIAQGNKTLLAGYTIDITERKQAEQALLDSENRFRTLLQNVSSVAVQGYAMDGTTQYWNEASEIIYGYSAQEAIGRNLLDLIIPPEMRGGARQAMLQMAATGQPNPPEELSLMRKDGSRVTVYSSHAIVTRAGHAPELFCLDVDLTDHKQAVQTLQSTTLRLTTLIENIQAGILFEDSTRHVALANQAFCNLFSIPLPPSALAGFDCRASAQASKNLMSDPEGFMQRIDTILFEQRLVISEELNLADGRTFERDYIPIHIDNQPAGHLWQYRDITERKRAEEEIINSEKRFHALIKNGRDNISLLAANGTLLWESPSINSTLGYEMNQFVGHNIFELMHPDDQAWTNKMYEQVVLRSGNIQEGAFRLMHADGTWRWIECSATNLLNDPWVQAIVLNYRDITDRKRAEEMLQESRLFIAGIINAIPAKVFWKDKNLVYLGCNVEFARDAGFTDPEDIIGKDDYQLVWRDQAELYRGDDRLVIESGTSKHQVEVPQTTQEGKTITLLTSKVPLRSSHGEIIGVLGTYIDITEIKRAEAALRENESRFKSFVEQSPLAIGVFNLEGIGLYANRRFMETLGLRSVGEMVGRPAFEFFAPQFREKSKERTQRRLQGLPVPAEFESIAMRADGTQFPAHLAVAPIQLPGSIVSIAFLVDITDRKRSEMALAESQSLTKVIVDSTLDLIWSVDPESFGLLTFNLALKDHFLKHREIQIQAGMRPEDLFPTNEFIKRWRDLYHRALKEGSYTEEYEGIAGSITLQLTFNLLKHEDKVFGISVFGKDITERKRVEEKIWRSEKKFRELFQVNKDGIAIFLLNPNGPPTTFIEANDAAPRMLGYTREEMLNLSPLMLEPYTTQDQLRNRQSELEAKGVLDYQTILLHKNGGPVYTEFTAQIIDFEGIPAVMNIVRDVTERKHAEEHILRLNVELEQRVADRTAQLTAANQELEAFSYSVSHDLRAPLRVLDGFSEILMEDYSGLLDKQGQKYLTRIHESSQRMGELIQDLLNLSRVTRANFTRKPVNLSQLANQIAVELQSQSTQRRVAFEIAPQMIVQGDENLLRIVLENLLNNAHKFTSQREHTYIQVGIIEQDGKQVYYVRDNGAGFDMDYANKLFGAFQRLHSEKDFPGTGIGLATVQRIIHRHGGRVWAEGAVDQGATFYFTIS